MLIKKYLEYLKENHFTKKLDQNTKIGTVSYKGKHITWYGDPEQMIVIDIDDVHGRWGNVYYKDKLKYLIDLIEKSDENIELSCSYGIGDVVNIFDIQEHQEAAFQNRFEIDFDGYDKPLSIGDEDLDKYLGDEDYLEEISFGYVDDELIEFLKNEKLSIASEYLTEDELKEKLKSYGIEIDEEDNSEFINEFLEIENNIKDCIKNECGDINRFLVQMRDGHHRFSSAKKVGEKYVCLNLDKESLKDFKGYYTLVKDLL